MTICIDLKAVLFPMDDHAIAPSIPFQRECIAPPLGCLGKKHILGDKRHMTVRDSIKKTLFEAEGEFLEGRCSMSILMAIPKTTLCGPGLSVVAGFGTCPLVSCRFEN